MAGVFVEIGATLRQAREAIGMSLDEVQEKTRIQKSFLIAIENGEFHKLPSPFYVRTYLRSYANCIKIEPHHILRQYRKLEQAERLTGVHKAITDKDLAQTQRMTPLQTTGRMATLPPGNTGVTQSTGRLPTAKNHQRINTNTALTARRTDTDARTRDREIARRDLGYQRTYGMTGSMRAVSQRSATNSEMLPSAIKGSAVNQSQNQKLEQSLPPRRQTTSPRLGTTSGLSNTGSIPPTKSTDVYKSNNLGNSQPNQALHATRRYDVLSHTDLNPRTKDLSKRQMDQTKNSGSHDLRLSQDSGKTQTLSRSSTKNKSAKLKLPKTVAIAVASLVVCIPLAWAIFSFVSDDEPTQNTNSTNSTTNEAKVQDNNNGTTNPDDNPEVNPTNSEIKLVQQTSLTNVYHLSGVSTVELKFEGSSWVQMRTDPYSEQAQNVLEDFTIKSETVRKNHDFSVHPELWIVLGQPDQVTITVNGEKLESAKSVNLKVVQ